MLSKETHQGTNTLFTKDNGYLGGGKPLKFDRQSKGNLRNKGFHNQ